MSDLTQTLDIPATLAQTTRGQIADLEAQAKQIKAQLAKLEKDAV